MSRAKRTVSVMLLAGMTLALGPSVLWATSAVPEPGAIGITVDPTASGTKLFGPLSVAYVLEFVPEPTKKSQTDPLPPSASPCPSRVVVFDMFVVATFHKGTNAKVFNRDFNSTDPVTQPICFENQSAQVAFVEGLISTAVIPFFFACGGTTGIACPSFAWKSITNFLSSGTGALTADLELAVK